MEKIIPIFVWVIKRLFFLALVLLAIFLIIGVPLIINGVFKIPAKYEILRAGSEWNEGVILGYYGSAISFIGTILLGGLSLYQNKLYRNESNKLNQRLEMEQKDSKRPILAFESHDGLNFKIKNITDGIAYNFGVGKAELQLDKKVYPLISDNENKSILTKNEERHIQLKSILKLEDFNGFAILKIYLQYTDIFGSKVLDKYSVAFSLHGDYNQCSTNFEGRRVN
ncbi:hypothetical protein [Lacrimispora sp.]|uniref:hypothetical protein n=1 Tax=Lacrimispora sp. TaxID=2719234 RepID=UPI0032E4D65F